MKPRRYEWNLPGRDFRVEREDIVSALAGTIAIIGKPLFGDYLFPGLRAILLYPVPSNVLLCDDGLGGGADRGFRAYQARQGPGHRGDAGRNDLARLVLLRRRVGLPEPESQSRRQSWANDSSCGRDC